MDLALGAGDVIGHPTDRSLAAVRVVDRVGRAGVVIRSGDLPRYWNIDVSESLRRKLNAPAVQEVGPAGCVDASLYTGFSRVFAEIQPHPFWSSVSPTSIVVTSTTTSLEGAEKQEFETAVTRARSAGTLFLSMPYHCVVGTKA